MTRHIKRLTTLLLALALAALATANEPIQRRGTITDVAFEGLYTFITAKDEGGNTFYVVTEVCKAEPDSKVEVIRADHYKKMNLPPLGGVTEDVYLARLIKLDGREVIAATQEGLVPQGCKILE